MVTIEKLSQGLADYIINELAPKTTGLKTWAMYMIAMTVSDKASVIIGDNMSTIKALGYMYDNGSIDDSKIFSDLCSAKALQLSHSHSEYTDGRRLHFRRERY